MAIIPPGSEVFKMKRTHGLDEREMELAKLLMAECHTTGDVQAKLKSRFSLTMSKYKKFGFIAFRLSSSVLNCFILLV